MTVVKDACTRLRVSPNHGLISSFEPLSAPTTSARRIGHKNCTHWIPTWVPWNAATPLIDVWYISRRKFCRDAWCLLAAKTRRALSCPLFTFDDDLKNGSRGQRFSKIVYTLVHTHGQSRGKPHNATIGRFFLWLSQTSVGCKKKLNHNCSQLKFDSITIFTHTVNENCRFVYSEGSPVIISSPDIQLGFRMMSIWERDRTTFNTACSVENEPGTRNARRNANRNPEWWGDLNQLQIQIKQKIGFEFVPRDTEESEFNQNLNSNLYREIPRNKTFSILTRWLKSPHHSWFRVAFQRAFRVSSSTERAVLNVVRSDAQVDAQPGILWTRTNWTFGVFMKFRELSILLLGLKRPFRTSNFNPLN